MKSYEDLKELLNDQLKRIAKKGDITPQELEHTYKAVDILKDLETIKAMEEAQESGEYSQRGGSYNYPQSYNSYASYGPVWNREEDMQGQRMSNNYSEARRGRDGDGDGRYSEDGGSYRRGRDAMGRFTSRDGGSYDGGSYDGGSYRGSYDDGYSGHMKKEQKDQMIQQLNDMVKKLERN